MTATSLRVIIDSAVAEVGARVDFRRAPPGRIRSDKWFEHERGFGIRTYASGRSLYVIQSRIGGRSRTVTLGSTSVLTFAQAQIVARHVLAHVQVGHDPATDRFRRRAAPRFSDYLDQYWANCAPTWKPSTRETQAAYRRKYLDHAFLDRTIDELDEAHVTRWFADLNNRTTPGAANRTLEILKNMFAKAEQWGYRLPNTNPCRAVRANRRRKCERFLSLDELARLGAELAKLRTSDDKTQQCVGAAITLLLLTGCRYQEIMTLQWSDLKGRRLSLQDSKTGPRTVWLGKEARDVIDAIPRVSGNPWMFWNFTHERRMRCVRGTWRPLTARIGLEGVRIHDLRHTFASHAAMQKETLPMIARLLGHASPKSTSRYAHLNDGHLLGAAQQIGDAVERLVA